MTHLHSHLIPAKNIALSSFGYWPKPIVKGKLQRWLTKLLLKTLVAVLLLLLCNVVETSRLQTAKEMAETAKEALLTEGIHQAFPVSSI